MNVAFAEAASGDAGEGGALTELRECRSTDVTHAGLQAAHELEDHIGKRALVRHAAFHTFRHQLAGAVLAVSVTGTLLHRADGAHAAVGFETTAGGVDGLARAFLGARE